MTVRLEPLTPGMLDDEQRALYQLITGGPRSWGPQHFPLTAPDGSLRGPFDALLRSPQVGAALQEVGAAVRYRTVLSDRCRELAILLVAAHWGSSFERESHEAVARAAGFEEVQLARLRGLDASGLEGEEAVVALTVIALLGGDLDDAQWKRAIDALGVRPLFELTTLVGYYSTLALQLRVFRVDS